MTGSPRLHTASSDQPSGFFPDLATWIIADTHFFHENIGRYCDRPEGWWLGEVLQHFLPHRFQHRM
jgi:hypothetical protein